MKIVDSGQVTVGRKSVSSEQLAGGRKSVSSKQSTVGSELREIKLPMGWVITDFEHISIYIQRGKSPKYTEKSTLPVINQKAIRWFGLIEEYLKYIHPDQVEIWSPERFISPGDILWNSTGTGTIGRACFVTKEMTKPPKVVDSHVTIIRLSILIHSKYCFRWIQSHHIQNIIESLYTGSTNQVELSKERIQNTVIPLPPLNEQKRIVAKLDAIMPRIEAVKERLDKVPAILKRFRQSVLTAAVTGRLTEKWREQHPEVVSAEDNFFKYYKESNARKLNYNRSLKSDMPLQDVPSEWFWIKLSQTGDMGRGKSKHRPRNAPHLYGGEYPFIQTGDVANSKGLIQSHRQTYSEDGLKQSKLWPSNTICITIAANIADSAILTYPACFPDSVVGIIVNDKICEIRFVEFFIKTIRKNLSLYAPATAQKNINLTILNDIMFPLPPLEEQKEIVRQVDKLFALADKVEAHYLKAKARVDKLAQSILAKAFRGELVPQDPNDEPAEKLLERILEEKAKLVGTKQLSGGRKKKSVGSKQLTAH